MKREQVETWFMNVLPTVKKRGKNKSEGFDVSTRKDVFFWGSLRLDQVTFELSSFLFVRLGLGLAPGRRRPSHPCGRGFFSGLIRNPRSGPVLPCDPGLDQTARERRICDTWSLDALGVDPFEVGAVAAPPIPEVLHGRYRGLDKSRLEVAWESPASLALP